MLILSTIQETVIGIVAAALAISLVVFTVVCNVKRRKSGKACCGGDCAHCKACKNAQTRKRNY